MSTRNLSVLAVSGVYYRHIQAICDRAPAYVLVAAIDHIDVTLHLWRRGRSLAVLSYLVEARSKAMERFECALSVAPQQQAQSCE
jgi:hypothetical protein